VPGVSPRRFPSPLRYPGGKGKIANYLKLIFLRNNLVGHGYAEPYAGGASVALTLLYEEFASHVYINDLNRSVFAFWDAVLNHTEGLCSRIFDTRVNMREWRRQRAVQLVSDPDPLDLAFSTFFLNRTNRSGIIRGGIIGGKDQSGVWKLDARYNKLDLIRRIQKAARFRSRISLSGCDAAHYITNILPTCGPRVFVYLDPPYYVKGEGLYEHFYTHDDHVRIAALLSALKIPWVVSYDAAPSLMQLYTGAKGLRYRLSYSAAQRTRGQEVMFFSPQLVRPAIPSPANIRTSVVDQTLLAAAL
jgi:DNA adenine methylase